MTMRILNLPSSWTLIPDFSQAGSMSTAAQDVQLDPPRTAESKPRAPGLDLGTRACGSTQEPWGRHIGGRQIFSKLGKLPGI